MLVLLALFTTTGVLRAPPRAEAMTTDVPRAIAGGDYQSVYDVVTDSTGSSVAVGKYATATQFHATNNVNHVLTDSTGKGDGFVTKYDKRGAIEWARSFSGLGLDEVHGVAVSVDDTYYVVGATKSTTLFYAGGSIATGVADNNHNAFVAKIDWSGTVKWVRMVTGSGDQFLHDVAVFGSDVYAVGAVAGNAAYKVTSPGKTITQPALGQNGTFNAALIGLDTAGTPTFAIAQGTPTTNDMFVGVTADASGPFVTGYWGGGSPATYGNVTFTNPSALSRGVTAHYSPNGSFQWAKESANIVRAPVLAGSRLISVGAEVQSRDLADGALQWEKAMPGDAQSVAAGPFGVPYFAGYFGSSVDVPLANGSTKKLAVQGPTDIFYGSLDPSSGAILAVERAGGTGPDKGYGIGVDAAGNAVIGGLFSGTAHFGGNSLTSAGDYDGFVVPVTIGPGYHGVTPYRALDSRDGIGGPKAKFGPGETRDLKVTGLAGVPKNATAIIANITAVNATADSFVTAWPKGQPRPDSYTVSWGANKTTPNLALIPIGVDGKVSLYNKSGNVDLILDISGWFDLDGSGNRFAGIAPTRILDTRKAGFTKFGPGETRDLHISAGVPPEAFEVVANVTVTDATAASHLTVWPAGVTKPTASNLNFVAGQTVPNLVVVKKGSNNDISIFNNSGQANVIVDIVGYYLPGAKGSATSILASRKLDTRTAVGGPATKLGPGETRDVAIGDSYPVKSIARSAALQVTVMNPSAFSHLTVWPSDQAQPIASNLNFTPGQTIGNLVMVKLGPDGKVKIRNNSGTTNVIVDVVAWYA